MRGGSAYFAWPNMQFRQACRATPYSPERWLANDVADASHDLENVACGVGCIVTRPLLPGSKADLVLPLGPEQSYIQI